MSGKSERLHQAMRSELESLYLRVVYQLTRKRLNQRLGPQIRRPSSIADSLEHLRFYYGTILHLSEISTRLNVVEALPRPLLE